MKYSFTKGLKKAVVGVLLVGGPVVLGVLPTEWMNMTIGGVLLILWNYAKLKYLS